jgi:hypothetical protein
MDFILNILNCLIYFLAPIVMESPERSEDLQCKAGGMLIMEWDVTAPEKNNRKKYSRSF